MNFFRTWQQYLGCLICLNVADDSLWWSIFFYYLEVWPDCFYFPVQGCFEWDVVSNSYYRSFLCIASAEFSAQCLSWMLVPESALGKLSKIAHLFIISVCRLEASSLVFIGKSEFVIKFTNWLTAHLLSCSPSKLWGCKSTVTIYLASKSHAFNF